LADLETEKASVKTLTGEKDVLANEKASIIAALDTACIAVKIEGGDKDKIAAMTPAAKITALQANTANTLAQLHVDPAKIPAGKPSAQGQEAPKKFASLDEEIAWRKSQANKPTK